MEECSICNELVDEYGYLDGKVICVSCEVDNDFQHVDLIEGKDIMKQDEKEQLLNEVEHKIGMVKTFYKDNDGAEELIRGYEDYRKEGVTYTEIKLFLDDLNLFLESI